MKTNAITRIIIWSIVLILLIGLLAVGLYRPGRRLSSVEPAATAPAMELVEGSGQPFSIEATVTATAVNVRSGPSFISSVVGHVEQNDRILISHAEHTADGDWALISSPIVGWINMEYIHCDETIPSGDGETAELPVSQDSENSQQSATVREKTDIYSAPNTSSSTLGSYQPGDRVSIGRQEHVNGEAWAYITAPETGWIPAACLDTGSPASTDPAASGIISLDAKQIREINIEWAAGNITIEPADVDSIQLSEAAYSDTKHTMVWKQNNDKLTVRYSENANFDFSFGITLNDVVHKDLTILVPMGWECDSLEIDAASATVDVKNLVINEVDFDGASGTCSFVNCVVSELDLDTASGDINFTGSLESLDCDAASASVIAVFDNVPNRIDMDSMSGDLDITLPSSAGFTVTMDGLSTELISDFGFSQKADGSYYRGDGSCRITMDAMSGDIYIREAKSAEAAPETP